MVRGIVGSRSSIMRCPESARIRRSGIWPGCRTRHPDQFGVKIDIDELDGSSTGARSKTTSSTCWSAATRRRKTLVGPDMMRETERIIMLNVIDNQWKDHLLSMDHLKEGIGLRGYGQKDPLVEYKKESLRAVPGHDGPHRRRDRPVPVLPAASSSSASEMRLVPYPEPEDETR